MDCKNIKESLDHLSLGNMNEIEMVQLESHLESCPECKMYVKESQSLWSLMEAWDEIEPDSGFISNFWDKAPSRETAHSPGFLHWIRNIRLNWTLAGAMASILLVSIITFGVFDTDNTNTLFMSADEQEELLLIDLDNALAKETSDVLSIYGPWEGSDVSENGGFN